MYRHLYVPTDNSEHARRAIDLAVELGRAFGARLTGSHVYAVQLHEHRFAQMEFALPDGYRDERALERQRKAHGALIGTGLRLISESYLDVMARQAEAAGLAFERKIFDGKHCKALAEDIRASRCDLVVMGARGMGAVKESPLGSVTERVIRKIAADALVVRPPDPPARQGAVVCALDGSPQAFYGLKVGLALGRALDRPVEAVAAYDPYLHAVIFREVVGVLSERAAKLFRFKEQERLHGEIIDTGLARIYRAHLELARTLAAGEGVDLRVTLLAGNAFEQILRYVRQARSWLLVLGRTGAHSDEDEPDLGSNAGNLLRLAPCNVLLTGGRFDPPRHVHQAAPGQGPW